MTKSQSIRISKKSMAQFPAAVANLIESIANRYGIKSFAFETVTPDKRFSIGEGEGFTGVSPDGKNASFEAVTMNTIGASGVSYKIGAQFCMPAGSYLLNTYYYGKYFLSVYNVTPEMIEA